MSELCYLLHNKITFGICRPRFEHWVAYTKYRRKIDVENEKNSALANVVTVMKNTKKGKRSLVDIDTLAKFMTTISCVPKLSASDMRKLCNELDWVACFGKSLIFLQGDFGAVFYMIAHGSVDLYLETSKDKEMSNARQYGDLRGKTISDDQCTDLGKKIVTLGAGRGFGEMAILSSTHQFRGATAVAAEENSLLLVVHADTYNAVLRKHHFRQAQMSNAMALLREIPTFNWYSYSKMSQIAYKLKSLTFSPRSTVARAGQPIRSVFVVHTGLVQGVKGRDEEDVQPAVEGGDGEAKMPRASPLYLIQLGRGQLIGQWELLRGLDTFELTYMTCKSAEVFELQREHFEEVINASKSSYTFKENPYTIPHWKQGPSRLKAAPLLHPEKYSHSTPSAFSTYIHGDVLNAKHSSEVQKDESRQVESEPKKQVLVSAFDGIRHSALDREQHHLQKVARVRQTIVELTAGHAEREEETHVGGSLPLEDVSTVTDLRAVLPLVSVYGDDPPDSYPSPTRGRAYEGSPLRTEESFHTRADSMDGFPPYLPASGSRSDHGGSSWSSSASPSKHVQQESSINGRSPRQPPPAPYSSAPSPRRSSARSNTTISSSLSKPATGIGALPPNTTARDVFSGAVGSGFQVKAPNPFKPQPPNHTNPTSRASSAGLNNTIPASHHILRQYVSYVNAKSPGPSVPVPIRTREPVKPQHKVSLNLPKVKFVPQSNPGSAQAGMWINPSPAPSTPSNSRGGRPASKPQSPFLVNMSTRPNEFDDVYEAERLKLKNEPLLLSAPIAGMSSSILSVRRSGSDTPMASADEGETTSIPMDSSAPSPRPPPVAKAAANMAAHMRSALVIESKLIAQEVKKAQQTQHINSI